MAQWTEWKRYTRAVVDKMYRVRGEYQIATRNKVIVDTGGSDSENIGVKGRLISRLISNKCPTGYWFRYRYADFLDSGIEMEGATTRRLIKKTGKRPKNNIRTPRSIDDDIPPFF